MLPLTALPFGSLLAPTVARFRSFSPAARAFLSGAALLEVGHAFQYALQNLYVISIGRSVAETGLVNGASALGVVASTFPSAWLYEKLGPRRSLALACTLNALAIVGLACSRSPAALMACAMITGAAYTLHRVVAAPFLVTASQAHERTHLFQAEFAVHTFTQALGLVISCLVAGLLEGGASGETIALRIALIGGALLSLLALLPYRRLPPHKIAQSSPAGGTALRILGILRPSHWHLWVRLSAPHFLIGIGAGLSIPFINLYFTDRFGLPKESLGFVLAGASLIMTFGALATPRVVTRLGLVRATILTEILSIPFFLLLALSTSFPVAVGAYVMRSALMNLSQPLWRNLMMELTPEEWRPAVNGASMLCWNLGWAGSTFLGGWLIDHSAGWLGEGFDGYALPMLLTIATYLLAITLEARFFWKHRRVGMPAQS
ncbi:MAG: MFS transporter [Planctomycetota bacterium]